MKITKAVVDAAESGPSAKFLWDEQLTGFGLKVTPSGNKVYIVQYRTGGRGSSTRRATIGRHGSPWTPAMARAEAERLLLVVATGGDPQADKLAKRHVDTEFGFERYAERYLTEYGRRHWRPRTWAAVESNIRRYVLPVLGRKPMPAIGRSDVIRVLDQLPPKSPALPRNVFAHLRRLFSWAEERGDIERSPFTNLRSPASVASRERVLTDEELAKIWAACSTISGHFGVIVQLLLLTGQRRDEVAPMRWDELDRSSKQWLLPGERTKNARTHRVPLTAPCVAQLDVLAGGAGWPRSGWIFTTTGTSPISGFSRSKQRLDQLITGMNDGEPLRPWRLHDLRRTMATGLQRLGVRFEVTEALLNHVGGARAGIAGVYQRHDWSMEKRQALEAWNEHVLAAIRQPSSGTHDQPLPNS